VTDCDSFVRYYNPQRIPCPRLFTAGYSADEIVHGKHGDWVTVDSDAQAFARLVRYLAKYLPQGRGSTALAALAARFDVRVDRRPTMADFIRELEDAVRVL
jgi:uncharacterized protein (DUF58 family)